jgi:type IV pilus assembly protein PilB
MATDKKSLFVNGFNGAVAATPAEEETRARDLAQRYRCEFLDLRNHHIQHELMRKVPVELMFRFNFVPLEELPDGSLTIAMADPSQLMMIDEIGFLLHKRIRTKVATLTQISDILKKTEQSQRVLDEASEGFTLDVIPEEDASDETISIERLTSTEGDISPIIRLVDTTIFTALQRRASDIHIDTALTACCSRPCSPSPRSTTPPSCRASR